MRDEHYRRMCDYAPNYDAVIDCIKHNNPHCASLTEEEREAFAVRAVHACISDVVFGKAGMWCSTGGALAVRMTTNEKSSDYKKVTLAFRP